MSKEDFVKLLLELWNEYYDYQHQRYDQVDESLDGFIHWLEVGRPQIVTAAPQAIKESENE